MRLKCSVATSPLILAISRHFTIAMALSMAPSMLAFAPVMPAVRAPTQAVNVRMETQADLETLAKKLNPAVGA